MTSPSPISVRRFGLTDKAARKAFIQLPFRLYADDPSWVPPLKSDVTELLTPGKNPFFEHAKVQPILAIRGDKVVGRICAHYDELALAQPKEQGMGPGTGNWGMMEAEDEASAHALIAEAEKWLTEQGMTRVLAPISLSIWDEPGLLVRGFEQAPTIMMGHHKPEYQGWIENLPYKTAKTLHTYELDIVRPFPSLIQRIVASGERSKRINVRNVDKSRFDEEAAIILGILNDAWGDNWGFVPITDSEIAYIGKKLKPLVREDLIMIAEVEGEPVAFMMTLPDANEVIGPLNGSLLPFGWAKMLLWLRSPTVNTMRVPLMGVKKKLQNSRLASQLAFMMIEYIRRNSVKHYGSTRGEIGWILDDNQGMVAIAEAIDSHINKEYRIYERDL